MTTGFMEFECMTCSKLFQRQWFDVSRAFERVHFRSPAQLDEVEIESAEGIGEFCSAPCFAIGMKRVMDSEGVPIPQVRPDIGPVEQCAKCTGPVDMSDWHLTYSESVVKEVESGLKQSDFAYIAVVCRKCDASCERAGRAASVDTESEAGLAVVSSR